MTPLFIYRKNHRDRCLFLVREPSGQADDPPNDYYLVSSIEIRAWLQCFLNYGAKDRTRMIRELEGK